MSMAMGPFSQPQCPDTQSPSWSDNMMGLESRSFILLHTMSTNLQLKVIRSALYSAHRRVSHSDLKLHVKRMILALSC